MIDREEAEKVVAETVTQLFAERDRQGISNYRLAKLSGLHESSLSLIAAGERTPSLFTLLLISNALSTDLGEIISELDRPA